MTVGFDFGTTNSLISVVSRDRAIDVLDDTGLPFPSVVRYEGEQVVVGAEAKRTMDVVGIGVHGRTVRSPKWLLGEESVNVGGVERSPVDIVAEVVRHVKSSAVAGTHAGVLKGVERAVVTIPVSMNGPRRAALRDAFRLADIGIVQYVHEPLAALYGYVRGHDDSDGVVRELNRRNVLVVDWGGGTLDLTLCRLEGGRVTQIKNGGSVEVGGDHFDDAIRNEVISRFAATANLGPDAELYPDARLRLLHDSETNKIALSDRSKVTFYRPGFFRSPELDLEYELTRDALEEITRPIITRAMREIEALLESADVGTSQVAMCLVVGGMAAMPAIRARLHEFFGPQRVVIPGNSATLVSQGAAWIANDGRLLHLARPVELQLARASYLPLIDAGSPMPTEGQVKQRSFDLYCADPSDGKAKFGICTPERLGSSPQAADPRRTLGYFVVGVDDRAAPFRERLRLDVSINDDLIMSARASSSNVGDSASSEYHDLEFGISLGPAMSDPTDVAEPNDRPVTRSERGDLAVRANITDREDDTLVPGDVMYDHRPRYFDRRHNLATQQQIEEHTYRMPCAVCGRRANDRACSCASGAEPLSA